MSCKEEGFYGTEAAGKPGSSYISHVIRYIMTWKGAREKAAEARGEQPASEGWGRQ
jgi:hypothetical protein